MAAEQNILVEYIQSLLPQLSFSFEIMKNEMPKKERSFITVTKIRYNVTTCCQLDNAFILTFHGHELSHTTSTVLLQLLNSNFRQR